MSRTPMHMPDRRGGPPSGHVEYPPATHIPPGPWDAEEEEGVDWRQYATAVWRHKWLVVVGVVVGTLAGFFVERNVEPTYSVGATLWIETGGAGAAGDAAPIRPSQLLSSSGWVDLMRSFVVLDPVVNDLELYVRPRDPELGNLFAGFTVDEDVVPGPYLLRVAEGDREMILSDGEGTEVQRAAAGSSLGDGLGFHWVPPAGELRAGDEVPFSVSRPRDEAVRLAQELQVNIDREGTFLRVTLSGRDPERITRTINALVERYADVAEQLKRAQLDQLTGILEEQLAYAEDNLREAEMALQNFRVQTISLPSEQGMPVAPGIQQTQNPSYQNFFNLRVEQEDVRRDEQAIQRAMERSREQGRLATEALEVIPSVRQSSDLMSALSLVTEKRASLRALRLRYTDEHPEVRELNEDLRQLEQETVPAMVASVLDEVRGRQGEIDRFLGQATQELQQIPPRSVEETRLQRRFEGAEGLFRDLQSRHESARLGAASTVPDVRILDRPRVPQFPSSDPSGRFFAMAMLLGLGLGVMGAIVRDRLDPRLRHPEHVTRDLGLPILGAVPHARRRNGSFREDDQEQVVEAFRNLRLAVSHAHGRGGPVVATISSPGVGDGKSFVTSNLALAYAEQGHRTLVIDGDVRRGTVHSLFACERRPGLTDYLAGDSTLGEVVQSTEHPHLWTLPSGSRFRDAPELLGLPAMGELLDELREEYDVILVDSSPLGAAVDPYLLGTLSGSLLLVFRSGATDRELAQTRVGDLARLPIYLLGAVLNDVPSGSGAYQYYTYLPGYGARDEGESSHRQKALAGG
jgi:polysaccharide biosynthesis transport protein